MIDIPGAAPMVYDLGINDKSTRQVPRSSLLFPQHLPKFYIFAEKGPLGPNYIDLDQVTLTSLYGDETFDVNSKYYTHQTPFLQVTASAGNNCTIHRLAAPDAKDNANIALCLDVLPTQVPLYKKNIDGSLVLDANGDPTPETDSNGDSVLVAGYKVQWVTKFTSANVGEYQRGLLTISAGTQADASSGVQSQVYPIFEFAASYPGEAGNKMAVRLYPALTTDLVPFPSNVLQEGKQFPYYFHLLKIADTITGKLNSTLNRFGAQTSRFTLKPNGIDPGSGAVIDLEKVINDDYINLPIDQDKGIGTAYLYKDNLEAVATLFYDAEKVISDSHRDAVINNSEANIYALNLISFTSSNGSPYQAVKLVDGANTIRITKNTNIFLKGSSDGTINETVLDGLVLADMENYADLSTPYHDLVKYPESIVYDSGFTLVTKKAICKFISRRKDTAVSLSTYAHNEPALTLAESYSVGVALKTAIELYPESAYFGTPVTRGIVIAGTGKLVTGLYSKRIPLNYELAYKASRYMGSKNATWKNGFKFDRAPGSIITQLKDLDVTWVPTSTRHLLWAAGLNFALNYNANSQFFPSLQTVYENDTSVLNSYFTMMACCYLNKVAHAAWREFTGVMSMTNAQLEEAVNEFVIANTKDKFDGLFKITPHCTVTELDNTRGFSWTLPIFIESAVSKTVMTTYVEAYRIGDLPE